MGAKALYNDRRRELIHQAIILKDIKIIRGILHDRDEYKKFASGWKAVNLDEFVAKFNIISDKYNMKDNIRKISFFSDDKQYEIVAAVGGKYFRIWEVRPTKKGGVYVGLDLKEPSISGVFQGKERSDERDRLTHFRMSYRKGTI